MRVRIWGGGALLAALATVAAAQPKLVLSQESWDFGKVWHPESPSITLTIRNEGTEELKLIKVHATCGCTAAQPEKNVVPPGGATNMTVRFDTTGKQKDVSSKVLIDSNDPARPHIEFSVKGFVNRAILREPLGGLIVRSLDKSAGQRGSIRLENQTAEPMKLELVRQSDFPDLAVEIVEKVAGMVFEVNARTTKDMSPGTKRGDLVFTTGLSKEPQFILPTQVKLLPLVEPTPPALYFDPTSPDEKTDRILSFYYYGDHQPFTITKAECDDPRVVLKIGPTEHPPGMDKLKPPVNAVGRVDVSLPPVPEIPDKGLTLRIETSESAVGTLTVLVTKDKAVWQRIIYGDGGK
jgi:hypothetical protein